MSHPNCDSRRILDHVTDAGRRGTRGSMGLAKRHFRAGFALNAAREPSGPEKPLPQRVRRGKKPVSG